jgi:hypothetical protein
MERVWYALWWVAYFSGSRMRYYKQFHEWPCVHLLGLLCGGVCLGLTFIWDDPYVIIGFAVCAVFCFIGSWILWKGRWHYLEINGAWVIHQGFTKWKLRKSDIVQVEHGKKGWAEEHDPYLKVHAFDREYTVDGGFLTNDARTEELALAMRDEV